MTTTQGVQKLIRRNDGAQIEAIDVELAVKSPQARPQWLIDAIEAKGVTIDTSRPNVTIVHIRAGAYAASAIGHDILCFDGQHIFYISPRDAVRHFMPAAESNASSAE